MSTQLDLARAYMEMNRTKVAKQILEHVMKNGNMVQQHQARQLIDTL